MNRREQILGDIQYLSHELNQNLLETAFFEFCCTRLFPSNSRTNQIRAKIARHA